MVRKKRRQGQRSTTGLRPGEKASDYPRLTIRLPDDVRDQLEALSQALHLPQWRVIVDAIQAYAASQKQAKVGHEKHVR